MTTRKIQCEHCSRMIMIHDESQICIYCGGTNINKKINMENSTKLIIANELLEIVFEQKEYLKECIRKHDSYSAYLQLEKINESLQKLGMI